MPDERRYDNDEVRQILDRAISGETAAARPAPGGERGLTLAELQDVAREIGVEPARIEAAALDLDRRPDVRTRRTALGLPVAIGHVVDLPRALTDREWDLLVADVRQIFGSRGQVSGHGAFREWSEGDLHVFLEPTEAGHRLRMEEQKGSAARQTRTGAVLFAVGLILLVTMLTGSSPVLRELIMLALVGLGAVAVLPNVVRLPGWGREREAQMEQIAARARELASTTEP